jgi:hypothetical protein
MGVTVKKKSLPEPGRNITNLPMTSSSQLTATVGLAGRNYSPPGASAAVNTAES